MKKLMLVVMLVLTAVSAPAWPAYLYNWTDDFENYDNGGLWGQGPWENAGGASTADMTVQDRRIYAGNKAVTQGTGVSQSKVDFRSLNGNNLTYLRGYAKFWVYDPGNVGTVQTDGRVGIFSSAGAGSVNNIFSAQIQASNPGMNWEAQWSYSAVMMDGVSAPSGTGYSFTPGLAAPRIVNAWSYVMITWRFYHTSVDQTAGYGTVNWYVNQSTVSPNLTLNFDSTSTRWMNSRNMAGLVIGSLYRNSTPCSYDNVEFHSSGPLVSDLTPEPSGLIALACGSALIGMHGCMGRRRKAKCRTRNERHSDRTW